MCSGTQGLQCRVAATHRLFGVQKFRLETSSARRQSIEKIKKRIAAKLIGRLDLDTRGKQYQDVEQLLPFVMWIKGYERSALIFRWLLKSRDELLF